MTTNPSQANNTPVNPANFADGTRAGWDASGPTAPAVVAASMPPEAAALAVQLRAAYSDTKAYYRTCKEKADEVGQMLIQAKLVIPHGEFQKWVNSECGIPYRTAQRYMDGFRGRVGIKNDKLAHLIEDAILGSADGPDDTPGIKREREAAKQEAITGKPNAPKPPKPPGLSPHLLNSDVLKQRIKNDVSAANQRGLLTREVMRDIFPAGMTSTVIEGEVVSKTMNDVAPQGNDGEEEFLEPAGATDAQTPEPAEKLATASDPQAEAEALVEQARLLLAPLGLTAAITFLESCGATPP